ncbi:MAG: ATP-binding protein [Pirellulaceae bacterium]|jgi:signal transduction histidine kinase|nr:ATP-binding protein [Pirellulaceae bacterium]MDP7015746.1 ATP-binding protein [Pirellulaceae bacterium]
MPELQIFPPPEQLVDADVDLATVLDAWHTATSRLQQTHETLCEQVRRLTEELENKNRELARKNRLADLGQVAAHVAHEVRNSLVPMTLYVSLLRRRTEATAENDDILTKIESGFTALEAIVTDLLQFTTNREPVLKPCFVRRLVTEVCDAMAPQIKAQGIQCEIHVDERELLFADSDMLRRALLNLVLNALDVMPNGGELVFTSCHGPHGFELEVADSGPGLSETALPRLFEPFFTTKQGGTGLGLVIVDRIAEMHGGDVIAQNCPEGGAAFTIRFPAQSKEAAA